MKVFSSYDDYGYEDERLYSVLLDEDELNLYSELQKEYSVSKLGNFFRKAKRNFKVAGEELSSVGAIVRGKDLTAQQTHALHRNQRLALLKNSRVSGINSFGQPKSGRARDLISKGNINTLREADIAGNGMTKGISGRYVPKSGLAKRAKGNINTLREAGTAGNGMKKGIIGGNIPK